VMLHQVPYYLLVNKQIYNFIEDNPDKRYFAY